MKKTYINPEMEIVKIKGQVLLAGSIPVFSDADPVETSEVLTPEFGDDNVVFGE